MKCHLACEGACGATSSIYNRKKRVREKERERIKERIKKTVEVDECWKRCARSERKKPGDHFGSEVVVCERPENVTVFFISLFSSF